MAKENNEITITVKESDLKIILAVAEAFDQPHRSARTMFACEHIRKAMKMGKATTAQILDKALNQK